jgi:hypothetical protein
MIARILTWAIGRLSDDRLNAFTDELRELHRARLFASIAGSWRQHRGAGYVHLRATHILSVIERGHEQRRESN